MKIHVFRGASVVILALLACALPACDRASDTQRVGGSSFRALPPVATAVVFGSVIDLRSGDPAVDAEVSFHTGPSTRSDADGRFEISGLPIGTKGELRARAEDGRGGSVLVLPLGNERREVVLNLAAN